MNSKSRVGAILPGGFCPIIGESEWQESFVKESENLPQEFFKRTNLFAISGAPLFAILLVVLAVAGLYEFRGAARAVVIFSYAAVAFWGLVCYRGAVRTCLDEGYWLTASVLPFVAVSYFVGPLPATVCVILATILLVGTAIEFVARDDADLKKLVNDFRRSRVS